MGKLSREDITGEMVGDFIASVVAWFIKIWVVMLLWNYIMPLLFGLITLNYGQTIVLTMLTSSLFKTHERGTED